MKLNNLTKTNTKKIRLLEEVSVLAKERLLAEDTKVKNLGQVLLLKVSKVVKCPYLEDYRKEVSNLSIDKILRF